MARNRAIRCLSNLIICATLLGAVAVTLCESRAAAADPDDTDLRKELRVIKTQMDRDRRRMNEDRRRMEEDRRRIEQLEHELGTVQTQSVEQIKELEQRTEQTKALEAKVAQQSQQIKQIETTPNTEAFAQYLDHFVGTDRLTIVGDFQMKYQWNDRNHKNSFALDNFAPIFLYAVSDKILFEGELEFALDNQGETTTEMEYAQLDYFLNDYMEFVAGKFTIPFGDYLERLHQKWIMKFVDRPLPYRTPGTGGIIPDNGLGVELRGAIPLGLGDGTWIDYTVWVDNGPTYDSAERGAFFGDNAVDNNQGKGYGARLGVDLLPIRYEMGRLHLAVSTLNGQWDSKTAKLPGDQQWFTSWGLAAEYQKLPFELRGEYLNTNRDMPLNVPRDKRQGWYIEASYLLNELPVDYLNRMELAVRWSGVNQNVITPEDSFTAFTRKPRQIAMGLDYWLTPAQVIKFEYERVMQHQARDFNAFLTSFAWGF